MSTTEKYHFSAFPSQCRRIFFSSNIAIFVLVVFSCPIITVINLLPFLLFGFLIQTQSIANQFAFIFFLSFCHLRAFFLHFRRKGNCPNLSLNCHKKYLISLCITL